MQWYMSTRQQEFLYEQFRKSERPVGGVTLFIPAPMEEEKRVGIHSMVVDDGELIPEAAKAVKKMRDVKVIPFITQPYVGYVQIRIPSLVVYSGNIELWQRSRITSLSPFSMSRMMEQLEDEVARDFAKALMSTHGKPKPLNTPRIDTVPRG